MGCHDNSRQTAANAVRVLRLLNANKTQLERIFRHYQKHGVRERERALARLGESAGAAFVVAHPLLRRHAAFCVLPTQPGTTPHVL